MPRLRTSGHPAIVRVQTEARAQEVVAFCQQYGWQVIVGIEPDKTEDISDLERLANPPTPFRAQVTAGRNDPCPCGSGQKYKRCCGAQRTLSSND